MREHPQLDLRVVGCQDRPARLGGHEYFADFAALLQPDRNILQIRELAAQPSGRRDRLTVEGVHFARRRGNFLQKPFHVGGLQLCERAVLQNILHNFMVRFQLLQHLGIGGIAGLCLLDDWQAQLIEQNLPSCFVEFRLNSVPAIS